MLQSEADVANERAFEGLVALVVSANDASNVEPVSAAPHRVEVRKTADLIRRRWHGLTVEAMLVKRALLLLRQRVLPEPAAADPIALEIAIRGALADHRDARHG